MSTGWPGGADRLILETVDSTNAEAARRAAGPLDRPLWIMARRQSAGRGRQGRAWESPAGNLSATFLTRFAGTPREAASLFAPAAGLAVADLAAETVAPDRIQLKWPNDVLLDGKKLAGILIESHAASGGLRIAVGIGVNLAAAPEAADTRWPATALAEHGAPPEPEAALGLLAAALARWEALGQSDHAALIRAWRGRLMGLGRRIEARLGPRSLQGLFEAVDDDGLLVLRTPSGLQRIAAADVFFAE